MATELFELGSVSSRGQIAIPSEMRRELGIEDGSRMLFVMQNDAILMKKVNAESFSELTKPLRDAKKKINEEDVVGLIHKIRKQRK